jgi:hypothetical protein
MSAFSFLTLNDGDDGEPERSADDRSTTGATGRHEVPVTVAPATG